MKKLILMSACVFSLNTIVTAQDQKKSEHKEGKGGETHRKHELKKPEERAQKSVDQLNQTVGLSDDQKTKVYELALARAKKVDAIKEKYKGQEANREVAKKEMMIVKKEYRQSTKALLTPEQLQKLKTKAKESGHNKEKGHDGKVKNDKQSGSDTEIKKENESFGDED